MSSFLLHALILISFIVLCPLFSLSADEESLGKEAEQAGKYREALTHYVSALQSTSEGSSKDQQLREKIISLALKVTPPPAVPDDARRYAARGKAAITAARSASDFEEAAREFSKALRVAPWWAESYFNRAVAQEKAGQLNDAISSLKLYLLAAPNDPDIDKAKDQIYALEYKQEKAKKEVSAKRQAEEQERQRLAEQKAQAAQLIGRWEIAYNPDYGSYRLFLIEITGDQIVIRKIGFGEKNSGFHNHQINLTIFSGTIQGNRIAGNRYFYKNRDDNKPAKYLTTSDYYLVETRSYSGEILWDSSRNSFTAFEPDAYDAFYTKKWERE